MANCPPKALICSDFSCPKKFKDKSCKCRTVQGDSCQPIKTVCAYEENGALYGCPSGCCSNQCEGQCGSPMYEDEAVSTQYTSFDMQIQKYLIAIIILIVGLLLMSSVSV